MKKINFNNLALTNKKSGSAEIGSLNRNLMINGNILPKPVTYDDIHTDFMLFVSKELEIFFNNEKLPIYFFSQQRFSEFSETWELVDNDGNKQPNFIIVTRETNPKKGSQHQEYFNIPGNGFYEIGTSERWDGNKNILISYKMKQPYCVDFVYVIKLVTNRMDLVNEFNNKVQDTFKSRQAYIYPNSHYMPITLEDISDEGDYELEERKIFIQAFTFNILGYIINEKDLIIEENICRSLINFEIDGLKNISNINSDINNNLVIDFPINSKNTIELRSPNFYIIGSIGVDNLSNYLIKINGNMVNLPFELKKYDKINVKIDKINVKKIARITLSEI